MFYTLEPQVTIVKTGSFANWITAAAAVATFAVVAKTAKKIVDVFIEPKPDEEPEVEEDVVKIHPTRESAESAEEYVEGDTYISGNPIRGFVVIDRKSDAPRVNKATPTSPPRAKVVTNALTLKERLIKKAGNALGHKIAEAAPNPPKK